MTSQRRRLFVLCEDALHRGFVERLADRWGIGPRQRTIRASPQARGSASDFVLKNLVEIAQMWRKERHDDNVFLLIVIDGDEHGVELRRRQLTQILADAKLAIDAVDPRAAILVPSWHMETWIAWLCGHRPIDETTRYKEHGDGGEVARRIKKGEYSTRLAAAAWLPPADDEAQHVPALTRARRDLRRLGVQA